MNVKFLLPAWIELRDAFAYYENQRAGLGHQFRDEVLAAVERIRQHLQAWAPLSSNIRRCRTHRFPYGIIYRSDRLRDNRSCGIAFAPATGSLARPEMTIFSHAFEQNSPRSARDWAGPSEITRRL